MKRILAGIIALTALLGTFTGCGKTGGKKDDTSGNAVEATAENDVTNTKESGSEKETKEDKKSKKEKENKKEEKDKDKNKKEENKNVGSYEEALDTYFDALNSGDYTKVMELSMPESGIDVVKLTLLSQAQMTGEKADVDEMLEEYAKSLQSEKQKIKYHKVVSAEDFDDDDIDILKEACSAYTVLADYINEHGGVENVDISELEEAFKDTDPADFKDSVEVDDAKYITVEYSYDGEDKVREQEFCVYRINGGDWIIDNAMMAYSRKSKQASANNNASSLMNAANTALVEIDEENSGVPSEPMMICSDKGRNVNVPADFDVEDFIKKLDRYYSKNIDLDWLIVVKGGSVVYTVVAEKGKKQIGTCPPKCILKPGFSAENDESVVQQSFDELYDICAGIF